MAAGLWGYVPWPAMWGRMPPPICLALATAILPSQDESRPCVFWVRYGLRCADGPTPTAAEPTGSLREFPWVPSGFPVDFAFRV